MSSPLRRRLASGLALTLGLALFGACAELRYLPEGTSAPDMYAELNCADCHGPRGEGTEKGPPLRELREHWIYELNLAEYLRDPTPFQQGDPRVRWLWGHYSFDMPAYIHLTHEQRMSFAAWLFILE